MSDLLVEVTSVQDLFTQDFCRCAVEDLRDAPAFGGIASAFAVKGAFEGVAGAVKIVRCFVVNVAESGKCVTNLVHSAADP